MYTPRIYYSIFSINSMKAITQSIVHNENRRTCGNPVASKVMQISSCFLCKWLALKPRFRGSSFFFFDSRIIIMPLTWHSLSLGEKGWRFTINETIIRSIRSLFVKSRSVKLLNCFHFYFKAKKYRHLEPRISSNPFITTKSIISIFPAPSF